MAAGESAVSVPYGGGAFEARLFLPPDEVPAPGILFLHDILGVTRTVAEDCRELAREGFVVLSPNLYSLLGRERYCIRQFFTPASWRNDADQPAIAEVAALLEWLKAHPRVDEKRMGMFGACLSGGYVLHMAKRAEMRAPVFHHHSFGFFGSGFQDRDARRVVNTLQGHFADGDRVFCPKRRAESLRAQLGEKLEFIWHEGVGHGLLSYERANPASRRAWAEMKRFYRENLMPERAAPA